MERNPRRPRKVWQNNGTRVMSVGGLIPPTWEMVVGEVVSATDNILLIRLHRIDLCPTTSE